MSLKCPILIELSFATVWDVSAFDTPSIIEKLITLASKIARTTTSTVGRRCSLELLIFPPNARTYTYAQIIISTIV